MICGCLVVPAPSVEKTIFSPLRNHLFLFSVQLSFWPRDIGSIMTLQGLFVEANMSDQPNDFLLSDTISTSKPKIELLILLQFPKKFFFFK